MVSSFPYNLFPACEVESVLMPSHRPTEDDYFVGGDCEDERDGDDDDPSGRLTNGDGAGDSGEPMETGQFDDPEE